MTTARKKKKERDILQVSSKTKSNSMDIRKESVQYIMCALSRH